MERITGSPSLFIGTVAMIVTMIVFSPSLVFAQGVDEPSILPDSPFWGIKLAIENIQEAFTLQEDRLAELILKHAEERVKESDALARQNKSIPDRLKEVQQEKTEKAEQIIRRLEAVENQRIAQQEAFEDRRELAQATNEAERAQILRQQQIRELSESKNFIEPSSQTSVQLSDLEEPIARRLPVQDIQEDDDSQTVLMKLRDRLVNSFTDREVIDIKQKFIELQNEQNEVRRVRLAQELDDQVNNPMVQITCFGSVNTLEIARASEPVKELQEQCPILRPFRTQDIKALSNTIG